MMSAGTYSFSFTALGTGAACFEPMEIQDFSPNGKIIDNVASYIIQHGVGVFPTLAWLYVCRRRQSLGPALARNRARLLIIAQGEGFGLTPVSLRVRDGGVSH